MVLNTFLYGFLGALAITPIVRFFATKAGIVDRPDGDRKKHEARKKLFVRDRIEIGRAHV